MLKKNITIFLQNKKTKIQLTILVVNNILANENGRNCKANESPGGHEHWRRSSALVTRPSGAQTTRT